MLFQDKQIAIVGVGYTQQGSVPNRTAVSFHAEAIRNAIAHAGVEKDEVDGLYLYRHFDALAGDYDVSAFTVAEQLNMNPTVLSQETYCTRGWLYESVALLQSGLCKCVVVSYGDNAKSGRRGFVRELSQSQATDELAAYGDLSTLSKYAMLAKKASYEFGTGDHVWSEIAIAQRRWANLNPIANMGQKPLDRDSYFAAEMVVEPFRLLDATPVTDGGRAIVLTTVDRAKALGKPYAVLRGIGSANRAVTPYQLQVTNEDSVAAKSGKMAFQMAGVTPEDMDACQLYDCFTYTVEATLRGYGFFQRQDFRDLLRADRMGPGGDFPVNTSGGMLSEAYFMGLTPICEGFLQITNQAGARQLGVVSGTKAPRLIVCSDNGGVFQSHCTLILEAGGMG